MLARTGGKPSRNRSASGRAESSRAPTRHRARRRLFRRAADLAVNRGRTLLFATCVCVLHELFSTFSNLISLNLGDVRLLVVRINVQEKQGKFFVVQIRHRSHAAPLPFPLRRPPESPNPAGFGK